MKAKAAEAKKIKRRGFDTAKIDWKEPASRKNLLSSGTVLHETIKNTFPEFVKSFEHLEQVKPYDNTFHSKICHCMSCLIRIQNKVSKDQNTPKESAVSGKSLKLAGVDLPKHYRPLSASQAELKPIALKSTVSSISGASKKGNSPGIISAEDGTKDNYKWSSKQENLYRSYRGQMRERLAKESKTGPWE